MNYTDQYNKILKEWRNFINDVPSGDYSILPQAILDSWERCKRKELNPYLNKVSVILDEQQLESRLKKNKDFINISLPLMNNLYRFVSGSSFVVGLFDKDGYLLEFIGDDNISEHIIKGNFVKGACWSEESAGTNGAGTVLACRKPLQICGPEHYCINSQKWTCSGAPIHDSAGELIGVILMTGPYQKVHPHTLGMVVAAAYTIENEIRLRKTMIEVQIAGSFLRTVISSIPEIVITIDTHGVISMVNRNGENSFGRNAGWFVGKNILDVFGQQNLDLPNMIIKNDSLTDVEARITCQNKQSDYTLSCYPISSMNKIIGKVIVLSEIKRARNLVTKMIGAKAKFRFEDIIGRNPAFLNTLQHARIAAGSNSNLLLSGETGTGKDIFAQAIHNSSSRSDGPYVAINCAAIPRDLISSELFGYSDGAFTGSRKGGSQGKFQLAEGGTIFLDELGEMPLELQAALLRVIEDKSIMRIGGKKVTKVDVRIIAATNKNLKEEMRKGKFREDLYYRANAFAIRMIPLRERKDDIPLLVECFVRNIAHALKKNIKKMEEGVLEQLIRYPWPGNVRELQNVLERMINMAQTEMLTADLLPFEISETQYAGDSVLITKTRHRIDRDMILTMADSNLTRKDLAKTLGISRSTLYRKLEELKNA